MYNINQKKIIIHQVVILYSCTFSPIMSKSEVKDGGGKNLAVKVFKIF